MASPTTEFRAALKGVIQTTFAAEGFPVKDDRLHSSLGNKGPVAGISPEDEGGEGRIDIPTRVLVQVYGRWKEVVDPTESVDPSLIEGWAWRFRRALRGLSVTDGTHIWMVNLVSVTYPPDPTGNITRFEAVVEGRGPNAAVRETVA